ncbi:MAG: type II/IV secretion system protein [Phycisphaera sp.]|nr:type II/IV secretion system protein [Phycisphaera sp.]
MHERPESIDARPIVDRLLDDAVARSASDVHVDPEAEGYAVRVRVDGVLDTAQRLDGQTGRAVVARLMVMGKLLTYRPDIPQEGRLSVMSPTAGRAIEMRVSVMPTTHGLRAVVRLPAELTQPRELDALGLPDAVVDGLRRFARADTGMLLLTGPAGSGKTTTIYALLEHIVSTQPGVSVIALEDPVERDIAGVTQIEVTPHGELTYERALRSILRQDPQVLMLGEVRDAATATAAIGAALSGHRLIATLHAGSPATALARLLEMGIEPYQLSSAVHAVVAQRLLRKKVSDTFSGRVPIAEYAEMDDALRRAVLDRADASTMSKLLTGRAGYVTLRDAAATAVERGLTDAAEVARVLGE